MAEYIRKEEYCKNYCRCSNEYCDRQSCPIWKAPAADVELVRHGTWRRERNNWYCSNCGKGYRICNGATSANSFMFCPNCGAKMDGGVNDGTETD